MTVIEQVWMRDRQTVLRLLGLGLVSNETVEAVLGVRIERVDERREREIEGLMSHDSHKRVRGRLVQRGWSRE